MKVLVVPDIHGDWEQAIDYISKNKDSVDKVVTLGDYVDDWEDELNGMPMVKGFTKLVKMARKEPDKFVILLGNHDHSYISDQSCSGHRYEYADMYIKMFMDNIDIIYPAALIDGILFSHGGVSQKWYRTQVDYYNNKCKYDFVPKDILTKYNDLVYKSWHIEEVYFDGTIRSLVNPKTEEDKQYIEEYHNIRIKIQKEIDETFEEMSKFFKNTIDEKFSTKNLKDIMLSNINRLCHCGYSSYGDSSGESVLWIRPHSLINDEWPEDVKIQVVGHTEIGLTKIKHEDKKLIVCDNKNHDCFYVLDTKNIDDDFKEYDGFLKIGY